MGAHKVPTVLGLIEYFVQSNDNADCVERELRFKFVDDLSVLMLVMLGGVLCEYNFKQNVANDIGIDEQYVPSTSLKTQQNLDNISAWTTQHIMKLNTDKTNYMVFSRSEKEFARRLTLDGTP